MFIKVSNFNSTCYTLGIPLTMFAINCKKCSLPKRSLSLSSVSGICDSEFQDMVFGLLYSQAHFQISRPQGPNNLNQAIALLYNLAWIVLKLRVWSRPNVFSHCPNQCNVSSDCFGLIFISGTSSTQFCPDLVAMANGQSGVTPVFCHFFYPFMHFCAISFPDNVPESSSETLILMWWLDSKVCQLVN